MIYIIGALSLLAGTYLIKSQLEVPKLHYPELITNNKDLKLNSPEIRHFEVHPRIVKSPPPRPGFLPLLSLLLVFAASTAMRLAQKWQNEEKRKAETETEKVTTELSFLKQQINPHFLFNALNNIYSLTLSTPTPASDAVLKLSSILRYMLYETEHAQVLLQDELNIISDFIELQKIRITDKVKISYRVDGSAKNLKIAPLLLIPVIENAYKHGVDNIHESFIDISVKIEAEKLELKVINSVNKDRPVMKDTSAGIGIKNIKRRLDLIYPENYSFETEEKESIFSVILKINLQL